MKRKFLKLLLILTAVFIFLYAATWLYYRKNGVPKENFTPSIVSVNKSFQLNWLPIHWTKNEMSDRSAMYIPVYLDTIRKPFWMQFDLGSAITYLYNISGDFPFLKRKEIALSKKALGQNNALNYSDINLQADDNLHYRGEYIPILDQQTDSLIETDSMYTTKIGDLGYDFIKGRILIIDYRQSRLAIIDSLSRDYEAGFDWFTDVLVNQKPIYLPVSINGKEKYMAFDNGSSAFTIWTNVDQWNKWRVQKEKPDTFTGYSWGIKEFWYRANPAADIYFLNKKRNNLPIWGITKNSSSKKSFLQSIKSFTDKQFGKVFDGYIGNEYFRDEVVIFDTQHNRLGIQQKKDE